MEILEMAEKLKSYKDYGIVSIKSIKCKLLQLYFVDFHFYIFL